MEKLPNKKVPNKKVPNKRIPNKRIIVLFRNELRITDNAALYNAAKLGNIIPLFVYDTKPMGQWAYGGASKYWLHHSLISLEKSLAKHGLRLIIRNGDTAAIIDEIITQTGADAVYCLRNYEPWAVDFEKSLHAKYQNSNIEFKRFGGNLLIEPEKLKTQTGGNYQVFTPFFKALMASGLIRHPYPIVQFNGYDGEIQNPIPSLLVDDLNLLPTKPNWAVGFDNIWQIGEEAAQKRLLEFLDGDINNYSEGRDIPARNVTSLLSPHLRFGEISPAFIWAKIMEKCNDTLSGNYLSGNYFKFLSELAWREFSYYNLINRPKIPTEPINSKFKDFEWVNDDNSLILWQKGQTGFPIIDAGMRELWQTGYMHNRVRMIVASFLTKDLLIDWKKGEEWFWDCLLDADLANNASSWQWVAGCGVDAAPYFRIFNPTTQSQKFDPKGEYIKRWVPELRKLDEKYIHAPETAPPQLMRELGIKYPKPIVNHKIARELALQHYGQIK